MNVAISVACMWLLMSMEKYFQIKWVNIHVAKVVQIGPGTAGTLSPNMEISAISRGKRAQNAVILLNNKCLPKGLCIPSTALNLKSSPTSEAARVP